MLFPRPRTASFDHRPRETLDTVAILKEGDGLATTLDAQEKNETNPISHNPQGINSLRRFRSGWPRVVQQHLTDRPTGIRETSDLGAGRPEAQPLGSNEVSEQRPHPATENGSNEITKQS